MRDEPVRVEAWAGGRGAERPRLFFLDEKPIAVLEVVRTWVEEERDSRKRRRFFKVLGDDGGEHLLYYEEKLKTWFHRSP